MDNAKFAILLVATATAAAANIYTAYKVKKTAEVVEEELEQTKKNMEQTKKNLINTLKNLEF